ncbi:MAG: hypothetical protein JWO09_193 [Bacteroidetes bacterium]|nr:hypothetical protein [Bacteroidota bacterium]
MELILSIALGAFIMYGVFMAKGAKRDYYTKRKAFADHFIERLKHLGYFEYADSENVKHLQKALVISFLNDEGLAFIQDKQNGLPLDFRLYEISGKELAAAGAGNYLKKLKPAFERMRVPLIQKELLFDAMQPARMIAELVVFLNKHFESAGAKERVFVIGDPENAKIIFLTKAQQSYISTVIKNGNLQPMELKAWAKWNRLI